MPKTSSNPRIVNRTVRAKLPIRRDPYWHLIAEGQHLGYRKTADSQGRWIARYYSKQHGRRFQALGMADDTAPANGTHILSFQEALEAAQVWLVSVTRADAAGVHIGPYTVKDAATAWLKTQTSPTSAIHVRLDILPTLGHIPLSKLTKGMLHDWLQIQGKKPTVRSQGPNSKVPFDINDPETRRKRRDTANRVLRSLRALLNLTRSNGHVESDAAWGTLKEFPKVAKQRTEYLTVEQGVRFLEACPDDFAQLVRGSLYTGGSRYSEMCKLKVKAYDEVNQSVKVMQGKTHIEKDVYLTNEEAAFFQAQCEGKELDDFMFLRSDGTEWKKDHQRERMKDACTAAKIEQKITFHSLRHTFASLLAIKGTLALAIKTQTGHSSVRLLERYMHLSPSDVEKSIRANKPSFGFTSKPGPQLVKAG
jgi:integrase